MEKIEIAEMPTKDVLEAFMSQLVLGQEVQVYFDCEKGEFIDVRSQHTDTIQA